MSCRRARSRMVGRMAGSCVCDYPTRHVCRMFVATVALVVFCSFAPPRLPREDAFDAYMRHCALMEVYDSFTPKHHLIAHALLRAHDHGNPSRYATWVDESLNKTLKAACRATSQLSFENSVLTRMQALLRHPQRKRGR